jgi:hypothetical protein
LSGTVDAEGRIAKKIALGGQLNPLDEPRQKTTSVALGPKGVPNDCG